ncbi:hypothetical protein CCR75_007378 [Bremia lactucae]|uniref:Uncharacterized protein n=1 Tax=Bremia lactucae TaxID=4779 RepID=A0A976FGP9_BRELC|nr:hypothetical protein CCR75_007378 [Bremia lactucae]
MMLSLVAYQKYIREEQSAMVNDNYLGRVNAKLSGKSLVICPLSLLHQWKNEAQERFRAKTLSVYVYYGDDRDEKAGLCVGSITKCDLVLTTYGVISAESEKNGILANFEWSRIILDEAHSIKNRATGYHKACLNLRATHRWCLTGTPIQNSLDDIFALICFLQYEPWNQVALWKRVIKKPYDDGDEVNALGRLKSLLTPILLRRTKHSRDKHGNLIITIPPKRIDLIELEFSKDERAFYQAVFDKSRAEFNGFVASGAASTNYVAIFALLLRLRQACNHPFLALGKKSVLKPDERRNMALTTKSAFRPCQNEGADAYYNRIAAHLQTDMQASRNTSYSAKSLTPSYIQNILAQVEDGSCSEECPVCLDPPQDAILTPCGHVLCDKCLRDSLASDLDNGCPLCRSVVDLAKVFKLMPAESSTQTEGSQAGINTDFILPRATNEDEFESVKLQQLLRDLQAIKVGNNKFPQQRRKVVIFSQWMSMLHMVSKLLTRHSFTHCMFHGGLSQEARERVLAKFANQPEVEVLVISLKAGGIGLNLTCASVVILLDPWWNPGVEEQAIDRVHRLGQMQDVIVKRYVVKNTVEDTILLLQQRKKNLANHALVVGKAHDERQRDRLDLDDMRIFFR